MFDPTTLFLCFEADDTAHIKGSGGAAIADSTTAHQWQNRGTSAGKFAQSGATGLPTWYADGPHGKPRLRFGGSHAMILDNLAGLTSLSGLTLIVVAAVDNPATTQAQLSVFAPAPGNRNRALCHIESGAMRWHVRQNDTEAGVARADGPVTSQTPFIASVSCDYMGGDIYFGRDGVVYAKDKFLATGASPSSSPASLGIGGQAIGVAGIQGQFMTGDIYAIYGVPAAWMPADMVPLLHYVRTKWSGLLVSF